MEIKKSKDIRIKLTSFALAGLFFLTSLVYFLGWEFEIRGFLFYLVAIVSELIVMWLICFLLIKFEKSHYKIDAESIKLIKNDEVIFSIENKNIRNICYMRFFWALLLEIGGGYLNISYIASEQGNDKKFSTLFPTGEKIHSISMSKKQAKELSKIVARRLEIK